MEAILKIPAQEATIFKARRQFTNFSPGGNNFQSQEGYSQSQKAINYSQGGNNLKPRRLYQIYSPGGNHFQSQGGYSKLQPGSKYEFTAKDSKTKQ